MTTALKTTRHATFGLMSLSLGFVLLSSIINSQPAASQQKPVSKPTGKMVTDRSRESQKKSTATSAPKPQAQASTGSSVGAVPPAKETAPKLTAAEATAHEFPIDLAADQVARRRHLRARRLPHQITAGIRRRRVELEQREGQVGIVESRHSSRSRVRRRHRPASGQAPTPD